MLVDCMILVFGDTSQLYSTDGFIICKGNLHCLYTSHEIVGIVREVGSNVKRFRVGDHVGVGTYVNSCRECEYCNDGLEVHCTKGAVYTFDGFDVDGTITKGGYSSFIVVHER